MFLVVGYLSSGDLHRPGDTLEDVTFYTQEELEVAEEKDGFICHKTNQTKEWISDIMIAGHDTTFIRKQGIRCDFKWMPKKPKADVVIELDNVSDKPLQEDYRSLARCLGIPNSEVQEMEIRYRDRQESVTEHVIRHWCDNTETRMTFQLMVTMLKHPGLVGNKTAAQIVEDTLAECGFKVS